MCSPPADNVIAIAIVPVRRHGRAVRINISIDKRLLQQIDAAAEAEGMSRSRWLAVTAGNRLADADASRRSLRRQDWPSSRIYAARIVQSHR